MLSLNIKNLRAKRGWTQRDLAKKSGITHATILKLESGVNDNPTMKTLVALSEVFDVKIDELVNGKKPRKPRRMHLLDDFKFGKCKPSNLLERL